MSALPIPPPRPQSAVNTVAPYSPSAMAPRTESALGPLHHSLKGGGNYLPQMPSWTEFIVPATDTKGHSNFERVASSPMLSAEIENIVASRMFPYRRPGEFWRHAAMKLLAWLRDLEPRMQSTYYGALLAEQDILKEEQVKQQTEQTIRRQDEQLNLLLERGDEEEAAALAYRLGRQLDHLPDTSWKRRYVRTFTRKYGALAEEGKMLAEAAYFAENQQPLQLLPVPSLELVPATGDGEYSLPLPIPEQPVWEPQLANAGQPLVDPRPLSCPAVHFAGFTDAAPVTGTDHILFGAPPSQLTEIYAPSYEDDGLGSVIDHETEYYEAQDYGG